MEFNISILGGGSWGSALAKIFSTKCNSITLYNRNNMSYNIAENVYYTNNFNVALENKVIFIAVPAQEVRNIFDHIKKLLTDHFVIICAKGIEKNTFKFMSEVAEEFIDKNQIAVLSGPNLADEIVQNPYLWAKKYLIPAFVKFAHIRSDDKTALDMALNDKGLIGKFAHLISSNKLSNDQVTELIQKVNTLFERNAYNQKKVQGIDERVTKELDSGFLSLISVASAFKQVISDLSYNILNLLSPVFKVLRSTLYEVDDLIKKSANGLAGSLSSLRIAIEGFVGIFTGYKFLKSIFKGNKGLLNSTEVFESNYKGLDISLFNTASTRLLEAAELLMVHSSGGPISGSLGCSGNILGGLDSKPMTELEESLLNNSSSNSSVKTGLSLKNRGLTSDISSVKRAR